ncbi:hypothetical protein YC2023_082487 [Brassica napus]
MATVGAVCDMSTNRLCLTLIYPDIHYDLVRVVRQQVNLVELGKDLGYIAACHCGAEYAMSIERVYRTLPPFSPNKTQTKRELDKAICKKAFDKITLVMPLSDAKKVAPSIKKYVKDMVSNNFPAAEHSVIMVSEEVSAIIQGETPIKRPDPGSFVLDCNIRDKSFPRSLCDLGSSVNLMPHSVAISLGYDEFKPTKLTLVLADRSVRIPEGVLDDVPVRINNCHVPTDFVVLKYQNEPIPSSYVDHF